MDRLHLDMKEVPTYNFDLSLPANKRWEVIFDSFSGKDIGYLRDEGRKILNPYSSMISIVDNFIISFSDKIMFYEELQYISKRTNMLFSEVLLLQLVYEANSACTSAIFTIDNKSKTGKSKYSQDSTNRIGRSKYFFRTMDWDMEFLKKFTIKLNVMREGEMITEAVGWLGLVGYFTATSIKNKYSISVNYRRTTNQMNILNNIYRTINGYYPIAYLVRVVVNSHNIKETIKSLKNTQLISPCYFIVCDWNTYKDISLVRDCIITRDCDGTVNKRTTELIQTNCDFDKTGPNILYSIERRNLFKAILSTTDGSVNDFLRQPIINHETIYLYYMCDGKTEGCWI